MNDCRPPNSGRLHVRLRKRCVPETVSIPSTPSCRALPLLHSQIWNQRFIAQKANFKILRRLINEKQ